MAAWCYTGPLGRMVAFGIDFGAFAVAALGYQLRRLSPRRRSR